MLGTVGGSTSLKNVRFSLDPGGGPIVVVDALEVRLPRTLAFVDRTGGSAFVKREVATLHGLVITINGWNGTNLSYADLVPGARILAFTLLETGTGTPSILQPDFFTKFPVSGWMLGDTDISLGADPSKWTTVIHTNVDSV